MLFIVDADHESRAAIESALLRRFGLDFRVLTAQSAEAGLAALEHLAHDGAEVALVAADLALPGTDGIALLERAHALHRGAGRILLIAMDNRGTRLPVGALEPLRRATALAQIDSFILKGWVSPDEWLYPQVQEAISRWTTAHRPRHEVVRVVGEQWAPRCHELRYHLAQNTVPFGFYATDSDAGRRLLREHGVDVERLPAVILHDGSVLHDPTLVDVAHALGVQTRPSSEVYDLAILGAGPAGLSAAVSAASEGLRTLVIEPQAIGGQAGTSSMIRNYLGFPRGVSGEDLTFRAYQQALLFGAQFVFMQRATEVTTRGDQHLVRLTDGSEAIARAVIIATGVEHRRLGIPALDRLIGTGVFYGAAGVEAPAMVGEEVYVIGAANSAGQAALHLARFAAHVTVLVRGKSLAGISNYLLTELASTANVDVRLHTRVVDGRGEHRLERLVLEDTLTRQRDDVAAAAVFVLIGAETRTEWLGDELQRDHRGFLLTGREIARDRWRLNRQPLSFETSVPGVFAVGDVRHGSVKRVAGAVGDGAIAASSIHAYLAVSTGLVTSEV